MTRLSAISVLFAGLAAAACTTGGGGLDSFSTAPAPTVGTNAPAAGFENVGPGSEEEFILNVGRRVYFAENSAELDETARVTLEQQARWLNSHPGWLVKLQGFADDPGSAEQNVAISQARANAAMNYLISLGVDANRLWAKGYGRDRIVRDCAEARCKSQNRRVVSNLREEYDAAAPQWRG